MKRMKVSEIGEIRTQIDNNSESIRHLEDLSEHGRKYMAFFRTILSATTTASTATLQRLRELEQYIEVESPEMLERLANICDLYSKLVADEEDAGYAKELIKTLRREGYVQRITYEQQKYQVETTADFTQKHGLSS